MNFDKLSLSRELKLVETFEFDHLIIILTFFLMCELKLFLDEVGATHEFFNLN
jgi:hypothetical protein